MTTYLEVRCCCDPRKLIGYLPVRDEDRVPHRRLLFVYREAAPGDWFGSPPCSPVLRSRRR